MVLLMWIFVTDAFLHNCDVNTTLATFRLEYEDDYEYEFKVLSTRTSKIFALQA